MGPYTSHSQRTDGQVGAAHAACAVAGERGRQQSCAGCAQEQDGRVWMMLPRRRKLLLICLESNWTGRASVAYYASIQDFNICSRKSAHME